MARRNVATLGSLQREVLEFVWDRGKATVAEVHAAISARRSLTYTTVLVAMQKLEAKGWLRHRVAGRAYVYMPARSREHARRSVVGELLESVFGGDPSLLLMHLLDARAWERQELEDLRRLIDERRKEKLRD